MQRLLSVEEMRSCDAATIDGLGVPGLLLMENAGRSVVDYLHQEFGPLTGIHVVIACGKGNNAGDGLVAARHCATSGAHVTVLLGTAGESLTGDARFNFRLLKSFARDPRNGLTIRRFSNRAVADLSPIDLIVDAVFGTGFRGRPRSPFSRMIEWMNAQSAPVVAVDIPSGINGTTGRAEDLAVEATATVTFGAPKWGLVCNEGRDAAGRAVVVDIGIPPSVIERVKPATLLVGADDVRSVLPSRPTNAQKYSAGKVLVVAGSRGYTGAAALCAMSALRSGAGAVVLLTPDAIYEVLAKKVNEVIVQGVACTASGSLSRAALPVIRERIAWADAVAVGPGLSRDPEAQEIVRTLIRESAGRLVLDADALNAVAAAPARLLRTSTTEMILTPHTGEFSRLTGRMPAALEEERIPASREFAKKNKVCLVMKGAPTATAASDGTVYVNSTGNPGMATVGSGDVLTGLIAGFWAQGMSGTDAAWAGVYVHGRAGDRAAQRMGERSLVAGDLLEEVPATLKEIVSGESA